MPEILISMNTVAEPTYEELSENTNKREDSEGNVYAIEKKVKDWENLWLPKLIGGLEGDGGSAKIDNHSYRITVVVHENEKVKLRKVNVWIDNSPILLYQERLSKLD